MASPIIASQSDIQKMRENAQYVADNPRSLMQQPRHRPGGGKGSRRLHAIITGASGISANRYLYQGKKAVWDDSQKKYVAADGNPPEYPAMYNLREEKNTITDVLGGVHLSTGNPTVSMLRVPDGEPVVIFPVSNSSAYEFEFQNAIAVVCG